MPSKVQSRSTGSTAISHQPPSSKKRRQSIPTTTTVSAAAAPTSTSTSSSSSSSKSTTKLVSRTRLYAPFRALGLVSNAVPFCLQTRFGGKDATTPDVQIITCLGDSWAMWEAERMTLLFVSSSLPNPISELVISINNNAVLATAGTKVYRFTRGKVDKVYDTVDDYMHRFESKKDDQATNKDHHEEEDDDDSSDENSEEEQQQQQQDVSTSTKQARTTQGTQLSALLVFGDTIASLSYDGRSLFIWSVSTGDLLRRIDFPSTFVASSILHPATYLNKILVGSLDGQLSLWNIRTGSLIHSFDTAGVLKAAGPTNANANTSSAIVNLTQSPAVDIVAVGFANGTVLLHDIRLDESLFTLNVNGGLAQGGLSFRSDGKAHQLAVASNAGHISIFDLDSTSSASSKGGPTLSYSIQDAHDGPVAGIEFVPGQPLLLSNGGDNSCKQWFFESVSTPPRLLKLRSGHHQPPHIIRYYGEEGKEILSAARDRSLRSISVVRDSRSTELSQGALQSKSNQLSVSVASLKLPPVTSMSFSLTRSRDWDDLLTTHQGQQYGYTWFVRDKRLSKKSPLPASASKKILAEAQSSCVSACGNFALLGNSEGVVEMYNMQSYMHRRSFDTRPLDPQGPIIAQQFPPNSRKAKQALQARTKGSPITGVVTDALNRVLVASTLDGKLFWFDFGSTQLLHKTTLTAAGAGISSIQLNRDSGLMLVICDDLVLRVVDIETRKLVREFLGFRGRILDACFSNDGRWLVTTSMDSVIRTFDIPSARLIDAFRTASIATSVTFSPTGDFLATSHVDSVGIYLWANKTQFSNIAIRGLDEGAEIFDEQESNNTEIALPTVQGEVEDEALAHHMAVQHAQGAEIVGEPHLQHQLFSTPPQLQDPQNGEMLTTLSTMPRARWITLLNLDTIKQRNKPKVPPKKNDEKAPFFLPQTVQGVEFRFDTNATNATNATNGDGDGDKNTDSAAANGATRSESTFGSASGSALVNYQTEFQQRLTSLNLSLSSSSSSNSEVDRFFVWMDTLSTPQLDYEIRSLVDLSHLVAFLKVLLRRITQKKDFEGVQTLLATTLRIHTDVLLDLASLDDDVDEEKENGEELVEDMDGEMEEVRREIKDLIKRLIKHQAKESQRLTNLLDHCLGSLSFLRGLPMT